MERSRGWNWNWNWHRAANQSPRPGRAASSATASGRSKNVCPASSAAGGQTNTRSGIQSGCQITIMVFIHKFISLFKHASEFTDTINNARPTNAMGNPAAPSFVFLSSFFSSFYHLCLLPLGLPRAIDDGPTLTASAWSWGYPGARATVATLCRQQNSKCIALLF